MIRLAFKTCTFHARMRQFSTLIAWNVKHIQAIIQDQQVERKYMCLRKPKLNVCRHYCDKSRQNENIPPLMGKPVTIPMPLSGLFYNYRIMTEILHIDKDFKLPEYMEGFKHAVSLISHALANADYEALEGLVIEDTIEILKKNVGNLTLEERKLIAVKEEGIIGLQPCSLDINCTREEDPKVYDVELGHVFCYAIPLRVNNEISELMKNYVTLELTRPVYCEYKFKRVYENNVGGSWIATVVNHTSLDRL